MKKYEKLKEQYPEYISLDQLYQICRIAKRSARYLVEHGIIPAVDTGRKTWRYKIAINDVITYLRRREQWGSMSPPGSVSSRSPKLQSCRSFREIIKTRSENKFGSYFDYIYIYAERDDILTVPDIVEMTGLSKKIFLLLLKDGEIKSLTASPKYIIPKIYLRKFVITRRYLDVKSNSESFINIVKNHIKWNDSN